MTRAIRDLSLTTDTPQGTQQLLTGSLGPINFAAESGGSTHRSAELDFYLPDGAVIRESRLRLKIGLGRSYEVETVAGASSTPTTSNADDHDHKMFEWVNSEAGPPANWDVFKADTNLGGDTPIWLGGGNDVDMYTRNSAGAHSHTVTIGSHSHPQAYDVVHVGTYPGAVSLILDGVNIDSLVGGPFTASTTQTVFDAELNAVLTTNGWHTARLTAASGKGAVTAHLVLDVLRL